MTNMNDDNECQTKNIFIIMWIMMTDPLRHMKIKCRWLNLEQMTTQKVENMISLINSFIDNVNILLTLSIFDLFDASKK